MNTVISYSINRNIRYRPIDRPAGFFVAQVGRGQRLASVDISGGDRDMNAQEIRLPDKKAATPTKIVNVAARL